MQRIAEFITLVETEHKQGIFFLVIVDSECQASRQFCSIWPIWIQRFQELKDAFRCRWAIRERKSIQKWVNFLELPKMYTPLLVSFPDKPSLWGLHGLWDYVEFCSPLDECSSWTKFEHYLRFVHSKIKKVEPPVSCACSPKWEYYLELTRAK
jgi:hypothetical protein